MFEGNLWVTSCTESIHWDVSQYPSSHDSSYPADVTFHYYSPDCYIDCEILWNSTVDSKKDEFLTKLTWSYRVQKQENQLFKFLSSTLKYEYLWRGNGKIEQITWSWSEWSSELKIQTLSQHYQPLSCNFHKIPAQGNNWWNLIFTEQSLDFTAQLHSNLTFKWN